ncbi:MAG: hypothetical protein RLZZ569_1286 [Bacteroidota bacterium]|jgi:uncharacterized membrane protein YgdD (TMEM256/DUF423 family)
MDKRWLLIGFILIFIGIILGAFGAHALKDALHDLEKLQSFETGVKYQIYHGLALIALVAIGRVFQLNFSSSFRFILIGVICFSVSIYGLTLGHLFHNVSFNKVLGPITPIGGLLLLIGWLRAIITVSKIKN